MKLSAVLLSFIPFFFVFGEENNLQFSFNSFPYLERLPSNSVRRVFQDSEGYMWFGTLDGLCRYDAYDIKTFRSDMNDPDLLTNNDIQCIAEDLHGRLWIGTKEGLNILDKKTMRIKPFEDSLVRHMSIASLFCDSLDNVWIGTSQGLYRYDSRHSVLISYRDDSNEKAALPRVNVNSIYQDRDRNIWILFWREGLHRYDPKSDSFTHFPPVGNFNNPFRIFQDRNGKFWIGTWRNGFYSFRPDAKDNRYYTYCPFEKNASGAAYFSIVQDSKYGYLWVVSLTGLHVLDVESGPEVSSVDISSHISPTNILSEITMDRSGHLWVGSFGEGAFVINLEKPVIRNYPLDEIKDRIGASLRVNAILEDHDGLMWLALDRIGMCFFDRKTNNSRFYSDIPSLRQLQIGQTVGSILEVKSLGEYWVSYQNTIIDRLKKENGNIYPVGIIDIDIYNSGNDYSVRTISEDLHGNVWIALSDEILLKPKGKPLREFFPIRNAVKIANDTTGRVWVATEKDGIFVFKSSKGIDGYVLEAQYGKKTPVLNSNNIQEVSAGTGGKMWIATSDGRVITHDITTGQFEEVTKQCGMNGEAILNILEDKNGHIWISSVKKIAKYSPKFKVATYYMSSDGIQVNSFLYGSCYCSDSGEVFFGGNKGFCSFPPLEQETVDPDQISEIVRITDVKINNQSIYEQRNNAQFNPSNNRLIINNSDKNIEIEFSSLNYISSSKIQYAYRLEGVDNDWVYAGNNRRFATYNNLQKGSYKFRVKATDANGIWSNHVTSFEIYKKPAFYETYWAYLVYMALFVFVIVISYRFFAYRLKVRNQLEIAKIEKEKSEELTQSKLRYFTNISHELLTPLTIISCLIDEVNKPEKQLSKEYSVMKSNVNRLKRLLQQMLDFRKVESGNMKLKVTEGDIASFIRGICYQNFSPLIKEKQMNFSFTATPSEIIAFFDADKIDKILFNLLSNAFKYTKPGGTIEVQVNKTEKNNRQMVQVIVSDTGKGIAPEALPDIFNRFFHNRLADFGQSNGIGLSLSKELVELHHGTISVESQPGVGTTFIFEIPQNETEYSKEEQYSPEDVTIPASDIYINEVIQETETDAPDVNRVKVDSNVLIVEDNKELLELIDGVLSQKYHTWMAKNGKEALKIIETEEIDVVVSDVMMPEMDGLELCKRIKDNLSTSHMEVLLLTARNTIEDRIASYDAGADGYISKPFEIRLLEAKINSMVKSNNRRKMAFKTNPEINISTIYPSRDEVFLKDAIRIIEEHMEETDFNLNVFAGNLHMSKASLYRKIKSLTGLSPVEFVRNIRLKHACQLLKQQMGNISDVAYAVGFTDPKYFTSCFKNEFGITPTEYAKNNRN